MRFLETLIAVFVSGSLAFAADVPKRVDPTADQRLELSKMFNQAIAADRDVSQSIADIGLEKLKKLNELQERKNKAVEAYQKAFKERQDKSGCTLDDDFKCVPLPAAETAKAAPKAPDKK